MPRIEFASRTLALVVLFLSITACGTLNSLFPDRSKEYKKARVSAPLEVPPDLTSLPTSDMLDVPEGGATLSEYTSGRKVPATETESGVLPTPEDIKLARDRDRRWLEIDADPAAVWPLARDFWLENEFLLVREDPTAGVLETEWIDSRADVPQGVIRSVISRAFENAYSSAYRDRYRMRMERGEQPGTTEIFITHQGIQETLRGRQDEVQTSVWEPRPVDPGLEAEMLKKMMIWLGMKPQQADQQLAKTRAAPGPARAELVQQDSEQPYLVVHEDFLTAWRSVGITLDRIDFAVEDRDRSGGIYYVRYNDPLQDEGKKGLSRLAFWSSDDEPVDTYQIKLYDDGTRTRVQVLNADGGPAASDTATRILKLLEEQLR